MTDSSSRAENPRAVIGDNTPDIMEATTNALAMRFGDLADQVTAALAAARAEVPEEVTSDAEDGIIGRHVKLLRGLHKSVEAQRVAEKEPHLRAGNAVDNWFGALKARLEKAAAVIAARGDAYNRRKEAEERQRRQQEAAAAAAAAAEAARLQREEAERALALEAAAERARKPERIEALEAGAAQARQAEAGAEINAMIANEQAARADSDARVKPAELVRTRHGEGVTTTMAESWAVEIVDPTALDAVALWPFVPEAAKLQALKAWAKTTGYKRPMAGAIIERRKQTVYR